MKTTTDMASLVAQAPTLVPDDRARVWVQSDLQLGDPKDARQVLAAAVDDMLNLDLGLGAVWCLGDALCGSGSEAALDDIAHMTVEQLGRLKVPVCYVMGNHELDLCRDAGVNRYPLFELARQHPDWHTMASLEDPCFARRIGRTLALFMGDHAAEDASWMVSHGHIPDDAPYPYPEEAFTQLRDVLARHDGPVVTAGHCAYPGGQRPSNFMGRLLPLPPNVRLHVHGHAHIGDMVWNKEHPWRRNNPIEGHALRQFNISALEVGRTPGSHSAVIDFGPDGPTQLHIRCHLERRWIESFPLESVATHR